MPLFFKFRQPAFAAVDIVSLLGVTSYLAYTWGQVDEVAGWALMPYIAWLGFASYLNVRLCISIYALSMTQTFVHYPLDRCWDFEWVEDS